MSIEEIERVAVDGGTDGGMAAEKATGSIVSVEGVLGVQEGYCPSRKAENCARADSHDGGVQRQETALLTGKATRCWMP